MNSKPFALALSITASIAYTICAIVIAIAPEFALSLYGSVAHLTNVEPREITLGGSIGGLVQIFIYTYLFGLVLSSIYNKLNK